MIYRLTYINLWEIPLRLYSHTPETNQQMDCVPNVTTIWGVASIVSKPEEAREKTVELIDKILLAIAREQARQEVIKRELVALRGGV